MKWSATLERGNDTWEGVHVCRRQIRYRRHGERLNAIVKEQKKPPHSVSPSRGHLVHSMTSLPRSPPQPLSQFSLLSFTFIPKQLRIRMSTSAYAYTYTTPT
nr:hypothetical protein Itr_chr15CG04210 [Ipomoea trifida]